MDRKQDDLLEDLHELRGKRLGCVRRYDGRCAPKACHGDVLAELADRASPAPIV